VDLHPVPIPNRRIMDPLRSTLGMHAPSYSRQDSMPHVLIVDDEPDNLRLLGPLLSDHGYRVHVAESGEQALTTIGSMMPAAQLDLVLLDILMPGGMDGVETCRRIKARDNTQSIPVVFLTGKDDRDTLLGAFEAGGSDYVLRPVEPSILLARVGAHARLGRLSRDLESELARRTADLKDTNRLLEQSNERLRSLANEISLVEEREKKRLAAELHDSSMQKLNLAQMQIRSAVAERDAESDQLLGSGLELICEALTELRTLQFEMSPPVLYQGGLGSALRWLTESMTRRFGVQLEFHETSPAPELASDLAVLLFQCARELVVNLVRHAGASRGRLELGCIEDRLVLSVADDGRGSDPNTPDAGAPPKAGYGLFAIRERLQLLGGELQMTTGASGTIAVISVPGATANRRAEI